MINENLFKKVLAQLESSGGYQIRNGVTGALGKYQFLESTLNYLQTKYKLQAWISANNFLGSPALQEKYFTYWLKDLQQFYNSYNYQNYLGKIVRGSKRFKQISAPLTEYGILASMHLGGALAPYNYFNKGLDPNDGFTSVTDYMAYFSNYVKAPGGEIYLALGIAIIGAIVLYYT